MNRKISIPTVALLFALSAFARDEYTRTFDKTISVRAGQKIYIDHRFGDVLVKAHAGADLIIHADIKVSASDMDRAKEFAGRVEIVVDPGASDISIRTRYPGEPSSSGFFQNTSYLVRYEITVPESSPLEVRDAFGSVTVSGVHANSSITTSHGSLDFRDGQGTQHLENSFASIHVARNVGDVSVQTSNGSVDAEDINGSLTVHNRFASVTTTHISKGLTIVNGNGSVNVMNSGGPGAIKNSFGGVNVHGFQGDLAIENSYGPVKASDLQNIEVHTSFGPVVLDNVAGALHVANQNGTVDATVVAKNSCQPIVIHTSFSAVRIHINGEASYHLNAHTSFGRIHTDFPLSVSGALSNDSVEGTIGGGHCEMSLSDSYGAIEILKGGS